MRSAISTIAAVLLIQSASAETEDYARLSPAAMQGERQAHGDIREGRLILRTYGITPAGVQSPYERLLLDQLGVKVQVVAGCVIRGSIIDETAAYNRVMKAEIARRFGPDALERIRRQVQQAPAPVSAQRR